MKMFVVQQWFLHESCLYRPLRRQLLGLNILKLSADEISK